MGVARTAAVLVAVLAVAGCTRVIDGTVHPAAGLTPTPVAGDAIDKVLPDGDFLEKTLGQSLDPDPDFPVWSGGTDELYDAQGAPPDCVGATSLWSRAAFDGPDTGDVVKAVWQNASPYDDDPSAIGVVQGVVAYRTAAAADAQFARMSARWQRCAGTTVQDDGSEFSDQITDVQGADSVVEAAVHVTGNVVVQHAQALGVRVNCLLIADVAFYGDRVGDSMLKRQPNRRTSATEIVRRMMDTVSELS